MAIQITMHFNAPAEASDRLQIKVTLPEKKTGKAAKLLSKLFCDSYHAQRANAAPLNAEALRLLLCGDGNSETPLALDRPIRDQLATGAKLLVARGTQPPVRPPPVSPPPAPVRAKAAALAQRKTKTNEPAAAMARQQAVSSSAQADLAAGKALLAAGRAEEAIGRLERAAAAADNVDAHFALGLARQYTGNVAGSIRSYERAYALLGGASPPVALHSAWLNVCHNLILVHSAAGNHSSSVRFAREACTIAPNDPEKSFEHGVCCTNADDAAGAERAYRRAIKLAPAHRPAHINLIAVLERQCTTDGADPNRWCSAWYTRVCAAADAAVAQGLWMNRYQRPPHYVRALRARPWWDPAEFDWCAVLERNFATIQAEYLAAFSASSATSVLTVVGGRQECKHDSVLCTAGRWTEAVFYQGGGRVGKTCALFPKTAAILSKIGAAVDLAGVGGGETLFSVLAPGTRLRPHTGSSNGRLTCHMGICIPDGDIKIRVGAEPPRKWTQGKCMVFDDSFEHEVWHNSDAQRVALLINFFHPDFPVHLRKNAEWQRLSDAGSSR